MIVLSIRKQSEQQSNLKSLICIIYSFVSQAFAKFISIMQLIRNYNAKF